MEHLAKAVSDALSVFGADFLRREVGCNHGEQLPVITVFQQVQQRTGGVAVIQHLHRLLPQVVNAQHFNFFDIGKIVDIVRQLSQLLGVVDAHLRLEIRIVEEVEVVVLKELLKRGAEGIHQRRLAVAAGAAEQHAELGMRGGDEMRQLPDVAQSVLVELRRAAAFLHGKGVGCRQAVECLLGREVEPKTTSRSPSAK